MMEKITLENFLKTPIKEQKGDVAPALSDSELLEVINHIESLNIANLSEPEQSNVLYWLTYGLSHTMKNKNFSSSYHIASVLYKMSEQYPHLVISMLGKTIEAGEFKGQTGAFVWMDRFYSTTFHSIFSPTLISINLIFSNLLEHDSKALSFIMAKPIESGFTSGTNALLNLIYALKNAADYDYNQSTTTLIAELLAKFITKSPDVLGFAITQEITKGVFSGTSLIDFIATILERCSKDNIDAVKTLCKMLLTVNEKHSPSLITSLTKIKQSGYNQGMNSFHLLLTTLVSVSYIENNTEMVNIFVELIRMLFKNSPDKISPALIEPINTGGHEGENGIMHLVHTLIIAMDRNIDTAAITNLLLEIIQYNGKDITEAFNSHAASKSNYYLQTPLSKLESKLNNEQTMPTQKNELESIISNLIEANNICKNHC